MEIHCVFYTYCTSQLRLSSEPGRQTWVAVSPPFPGRPQGLRTLGSFTAPGMQDGHGKTSPLSGLSFLLWDGDPPCQWEGPPTPSPEDPGRRMWAAIFLDSRHLVLSAGKETAHLTGFSVLCAEEKLQVSSLPNGGGCRQSGRK